MKTHADSEEANSIPDELAHALQLSSRLKTRFELLPKEDQQGYIDYINGTKKNTARRERVETCIPFIMKLRDPKELEN